MPFPVTKPFEEEEKKAQPPPPPPVIGGQPPPPPPSFSPPPPPTGNSPPPPPPANNGQLTDPVSGLSGPTTPTPLVDANGNAITLNPIGEDGSIAPAKVNGLTPSIVNPRPFNPPPPVFGSTPNMPGYTPPNAVNPITTVTSGSVNPVVAATSGNTTIGGANTVGNQSLEDAAKAKATLAANTTVNRTDQDQTRSQQMDFLQMLKDSAYGTGGPSAAEQLFKKLSDEATKSQYAIAASQHGYASGAANRQAGFNVAGMEQHAANEAGILRAQEQQQARALYGQTIGQARDSDQKLAIAQANLDQATAALNANLATNVDMNNAAEVNKRNQLKAELDQATAFRNAAADENIRVKNAEMNQSNQQFNAGQTNTVNTFNAGNEQQNRQFNAGAENDTNKFNTAQEQQRNIVDAQLKQNYGISASQLEADMNKFNAGQANSNTQFYAGLSNQRDIANISAALQAMGYQNDQIRMFIQAYMGGAGAVAATTTANRQEQDKMFWDLVNVGANYYSNGLYGAATNAAQASNPKQGSVVGGYAGPDSSQINTGNTA